MNTPSHLNELPADILNQLVDLLTKFGVLDKYEARLTFLESSGLVALQPHLPLQETTHHFVHALIRECRRVGNFTLGGEPAYYMLLGYLQERVAGHDAEREFVASLRHTATPPVTHADTLQPPSLDFTGRTAEIERLTKAIRHGRPVMISGMGGIGKSDLARKVAETVRLEFPGLALQVELQPDNKPVTAAELVGTLILALYPFTKLPDTLEQRIAILRSLMQQYKGLLLLDNAVARNQIQPLEALWHGWAVLITSRTNFVIPSNHSEQLFPMEKVDSEALVITLTTEYGRSLEKEEVAQVAQICQFHPLALHVASGYLGVNKHHSVNTYVEMVGNTPITALVLDEYANVGRVLGVSVEHLHNANPKMCERWHLLALMPDAFDAELAGALLGKLEKRKLVVIKDPSLPYALSALFPQLKGPSVTPIEEKSTKELLDNLLRLNLLQIIPFAQSRNTVRYRLHDFLTDYALHHSPLSPSQKRQSKAIRCHALAVVKRGDDLDILFSGGRQVEAVLQFDALWNHLNGAWQRLRNAKDEFATFVVDSFASKMPYLLDLRLSPRILITYQEAALRATRIRNDKFNEAVHLGNLGVAHRKLGEISTAIGYFEQALAFAREIGDKDGEGKQLGNLGNAYADLRQLQTAIHYYEQALVIQREIGYKRGESIQIGNLGLAYADLGKTYTAIDYYKQALVIAREIGDKSSEGNALCNLGVAYRNIGDIRTAIDYYEQALVVDREIGDKRGEGTDCWNLALAYDYEGEREKAIAYAHTALTLYEAMENPSSEKVRNKLRQWGVMGV
jgi:tetratricopeptide (TPR) repeat protein